MQSPFRNARGNTRWFSRLCAYSHRFNGSLERMPMLTEQVVRALDPVDADLNSHVVAPHDGITHLSRNPQKIPIGQDANQTEFRASEVQHLREFWMNSTFTST